MSVRPSGHAGTHHLLRLAAGLAGLFCTAAAQAADPPVFDGSDTHAVPLQADAIWTQLEGSWRGEDATLLTIGADGFTLRTDQWSISGRVDQDPDMMPGDPCAVFFHPMLGKELRGFYTQFREAQASYGDPQPLPAELDWLDPREAYPVMTANCYEVGYEYVLLNGALVRFGTGEGMIEPVVHYSRSTGGPSLPADPMAGFTTEHRYWSAECSTCQMPEDDLCLLSTAGAGAPPLVLRVNGGQVSAVSIPPMADFVETPVRMSIDGDPPEIVAVRYWGMDGSLNIDSPPDVARLVEAFRAGYTVSFTATDPQFAAYWHAYSLLGFSATLDAVLANAPIYPPPCDG